MLPILLYEPLPLIYLCGGATLLATGENGLLLMSASLFYWAGALIWVIRSKNRRTDVLASRGYPTHKFLLFPESLYEFRPFFFIPLLVFYYSGIQVRRYGLSQVRY